MKPVAVDAIQAAGAGRPGPDPRPHHCTAPTMTPVISPPIKAAVMLSTGPTSSSAVNPPSGNPVKVTIQRPTMRSRKLRVGVVDGEVAMSVMRRS